MSGVATASAITTTAAPSRRPNLVQVGTIVWLSSELMFFAALFAMYFTIRSVSLGQGKPWPTLPEGVHLDIPYALVNTIVLVLSSVTCQLGVWAAEKGQVRKLRFWYIISFLMGAWFVGGQLYEYHNLVEEGVTLSSNAYGSVFYLTTGFHGLHVTGGLIAFLFMLGRTYAAKRFTHEQATSAIVVSYYWHFVDVVWIGLFATIYIIK
ncbi:cytochrome c oxidase subunit 3 [Sphaerisporangium dianthi]|uniref:cytochrome-c oxidase n=1 Tax=Sphaerisporangium dianthi TaxID=1436120 RepID=A0ABV9CHV6_9ACTN